MWRTNHPLQAQSLGVIENKIKSEPWDDWQIKSVALRHSEQNLDIQSDLWGTLGQPTFLYICTIKAI